MQVQCREPRAARPRALSRGCARCARSRRGDTGWPDRCRNQQFWEGWPRSSKAICVFGLCYLGLCLFGMFGISWGPGWEEAQ